MSSFESGANEHQPNDATEPAPNTVDVSAISNPITDTALAAMSHTELRRAVRAMKRRYKLEPSRPPTTG
ncbi:hypothetical protein GCM10009778_09100 [Microbacterium terricola]